MEPMVSEMELSIDCDYIGQPDNTKITIHWCCHIQLDPYIEQLESFKNVMKIKVYNTHHHILKTRTHANLDKVCKNGKTAYLHLHRYSHKGAPIFPSTAYKVSETQYICKIYKWDAE